MSANVSPKIELDAPAIASGTATVADMAQGDETHGEASCRATAVVTGRKKRGVRLPESELPPHPGPLTWVDPTAEVCDLAKGGMTVEAIADVTRLTRCQVEDVLDLAGVRRLHAPPKKTARRKFDRSDVRAAHAAGESRNEIAARLGISLASVSLAINERGAS
jgi:uncharacterized protein (DUF433 family)